jgi:hypothetical protein
MKLAMNKELLFKQRFQPWRPPVLLFLRTTSSHDSSVLRFDFTDCVLLILDRHLQEEEEKESLYRVSFQLFSREKVKISWREGKREKNEELERERVSLSSLILAKSTNPTSFLFPSLFFLII